MVRFEFTKENDFFIEIKDSDLKDRERSVYLLKEEAEKVYKCMHRHYEHEKLLNGVGNE